MGELAQGIKATFEGNALQIHIVGEGGLLHHASDEVVGNKVHPQFTRWTQIFIDTPSVPCDAFIHAKNSDFVSYSPDGSSAGYCLGGGSSCKRSDPTGCGKISRYEV